MRNPFRRIVPILLSIAVIAGAVWYLFVYDRDFSRDFLITQARFFESSGYRNVSTWLYDQAYIFADNDETVAIELAQQYKDSGNYTKAEYTLSKAISYRPSAALYTELCKTYVEQDKLLDAVNMLDKIADPAIKAQLDAMRPAAPTVSMDPGFYNQYIQVDVLCDSGTLYVNANGSYPSVSADLYKGTLDIPQGETKLYAVVVGENGLVSPLGLYGYTVGGVVEVMTFVDPFVEASVRSILDVSKTDVIYTSDLWKITEFNIPMYTQSYEDLRHMTFLEKLSIQNALSGKLDVLTNLTQLRELTITGCALSSKSIAAIASLPELTHLTMAHCSISDISALSNARGLKYLDLNYNSIGNLSALSSLTALEELYLSHNAVKDLTPLSGLSALKVLDVSYNSISSVAPICTCTSLQRLNVSYNQLLHLSAMDNLVDLMNLNAAGNKLTTIAVLQGCTLMVDLDVSHNELTDISPVASMTMLRNLNFSYNSVTTLPQWSQDRMLVTMDGSYNLLSDVTPLSNLLGLNRLNLDYNKEISDVSPLAACRNLMEVNLFGTKVIDVSMLTGQSVTVHYNPTEVEVTVPEETEPETEPTEPEE